MKSIALLKSTIDDQQLRVQLLEHLIEHQSKAYAQGYHQGLVDCGKSLIDFSLSEMSDEYRTLLYSKGLKEYPTIKL